MGGSPGFVVYNDADEQWVFKSSYLPESDYDVLRRLDLSAIDLSAYVKSEDLSAYAKSEDLSAYVKIENSTPLTVTVPYDYGFSLQTPNGIPLIKTIDLNRTSINSLSTGNAEIGRDLVKYPGAGVDTAKLSAWQWIKTG